VSKFSNDLMNKYIFSRFSYSNDVIVGPRIGVDVAITRLKDKMFLIFIFFMKLLKLPICLLS